MAGAAGRADAARASRDRARRRRGRDRAHRDAVTLAGLGRADCRIEAWLSAPSRSTRFLRRPAGPMPSARPLAGDASFRRYCRLARNGATTMLMDAPPPQEDVRPYLAVARHLRALDFSAPAILAAEEETGLLLIEDFGDGTYTRLLAAGDDERALYALAVDVLIALHRRFDAAHASWLPPYDDTRLLNEAALLVDWYLPAITGRQASPALRAEYLRSLARALAGRARRAAIRWCCAITMSTISCASPAATGSPRAACWISRMRCSVPPPTISSRSSRMRGATSRPISLPRWLRAISLPFPALDRAAFDASFAVLGAQRHCKVIGIFTRLCRARRQAALSRAYSAVLAAARGQFPPPGAGAGRSNGSTAIFRANCGASRRRRHDRERHGPRGRVRHAHAADHRSHAEAADPARRARAGRSRHRSAGRGRA